MNAKSKFTVVRMSALAWILVMAITGFDARSQPALISSVPGDGATGVSPGATVQFTFDLPMETAATDATFFDVANPFNPLSVTMSWNNQLSILTCSPNPPFPANTLIGWVVVGEDITGDPLEATQGFFTTGGGGGADLVLTNLSWAGTFSFDVLSSPGQTLTVEASTSLNPGSWTPIAFTNSPTGRVRITDPLSIAIPIRFYRARQGGL